MSKGVLSKNQTDALLCLSIVLIICLLFACWCMVSALMGATHNPSPLIGLSFRWSLFGFLSTMSLSIVLLQSRRSLKAGYLASPEEGHVLNSKNAQD